VRRSSLNTWLVCAALVVAMAALWPATAHAQRRGFRGGFRGPVVVVGGYYHGPFWYDPFWYDPFWAPWYPYPYEFYAYDGPRYNHGAEVRVQVKPKDAQVFVDGYYTGIVDDFDGVFQRLHVVPGEHEIVLYLPGYRTVHQKLSLAPGSSYKLHYAMEKLAAGQVSEPAPTPPPPPPPQAQGQEPGAPPQQPYAPPRRPYGPRTPYRGAPPDQPAPPDRPMPPSANPSAMPSGYGTLAIRVQPLDAEVLIDGEPWRGPEGHDRLTVEVAEGSHQVEVRKNGYRTFLTSVQIRRGETTPLNVSLSTDRE
jgi:hypothetical protein